MRIVGIRETAVPLKSTLANSSFDFSEMTTSVVAVITDIVRNGKPICGFAFNSTGRYACGAQMRARFIPRILAAEPATLLDDTGNNLDPGKIFACMMRREKSGGHSERSIAIGTIEVAIWDAVAKIADKPLHTLLAERFNGGKVPAKVFCYVGGGWYWPGQTIRDLQDEMRRHLGAGYAMVKMKVGGLPLAEDLRRLEAVLEVVGSGGRLAVDANCKFDRDEALRYAKALAPFKLRWFEEPCDPLDFALFAELAEVYDQPLATGENLIRHRMSKIWCASAASELGATLSRSIRRKPTALANTHARSKCWQRTGGGAPICFPTAATRCHSPSLPASALAAPNPIPVSLVISVVLPMTPKSRTARFRFPIALASVSRGRRASTGSCANWPPFEALSWFS